MVILCLAEGKVSCLFDFSVSCDGVEQSIRQDVSFLLGSVWG